MNKVEILSLFGFLLMFTLNVVFCGRNALFSLSDDNDNDHIHDDFNVYDNKDSLFDAGKILKRDKRFLLWTGGGISKVNEKLIISRKLINYSFRLFWVSLRQLKLEIM